VVLLVAPLFVTGLKLQLFSSMGLKDKMVLKKPLKSTPKSKCGATDSTHFSDRVKITNFFKHGLKT
jgi:hypothetical protein